MLQAVAPITAAQTSGHASQFILYTRVIRARLTSHFHIWTDYMQGNQKKRLVFDKMIYSEYSSYLSRSDKGFLNGEGC